MPAFVAAVDAVLAWLLAHPEQTVTLVVAIAGTATHYSRTGRLPIGRLPFRALQDSASELADRYFGTDRPRGVPGLTVRATRDGLEAALREQYFESADDYSFEYDGEVLNLRRPNGTITHPTTGVPVPMELHVRTFETASGEGQFVIAHDEASRAEAWGAHWRETLLSWERGRDDLQAALDEAGIDYEPVESEAAAGVDVVS